MFSEMSRASDSIVRLPLTMIMCLAGFAGALGQGLTLAGTIAAGDPQNTVNKNSFYVSASNNKPNPVLDIDRHLIFLNQSGFNTGWPKRFTAPLSPDGTSFHITSQNDLNVLYSGDINDHVGDFSDFVPPDPEMQYVVRIGGDDKLRAGISDPFFVAPFWMQRVTLEPMLRFFVDDRAVTGSLFGGLCAAPWRDSPFYAYSTPSLIHLYLTHPSFYKQQKVEMDWQRDLSRALDIEREFVMNTDWGLAYDPIQLAQKIRVEIDPPVGENVPDIIQLIHWGMSWWLLQPESKDHAGTEHKLHGETVANFAFFLYAYPYMDEYFTHKFYNDIKHFTFAHWEESGLFEVDKTIGTFKGRYAPGWTILPNLMMYEVARSDGRPDAGRFIEAARAQAQWIVDDLDFSDPLVTKGQRMSEHKTMTGLIYLARHYPDYAPAGLQDKVSAWITTVIARSANSWDFRKYDDSDNWSLPYAMPGHTGGGSSWNEPGNLGGLPSSIWKAASMLDDSEGSAGIRDRLNQIAVAQWDVLFGRNPIGAHSAWRGPLDFVGVERGWPVKYRPVCAFIETVRAGFCSGPATEHFPFNPEGKFRHPEGWTAFNAAFNVALAEAVHQDISFEYEDGILRVEGPFFTPEIEVQVVDSKGSVEKLKLYADDFRQTVFSIPFIINGPASVRYGHGFFATSVQFN
jgi:hypothetical protein